MLGQLGCHDGGVNRTHEDVLGALLDGGTVDRSSGSKGRQGKGEHVGKMRRGEGAEERCRKERKSGSEQEEREKAELPRRELGSRAET